MADLSILDLADKIKEVLTNDPLVSAAVSSTISPAGRAILAELVSKFVGYEQDKENEKAQAVQAASVSAGIPTPSGA